jgi:hypothetical protein
MYIQLSIEQSIQSLNLRAADLLFAAIFFSLQACASETRIMALARASRTLPRHLLPYFHTIQRKLDLQLAIFESRISLPYLFLG